MNQLSISNQQTRTVKPTWETEVEQAQKRIVASEQRCELLVREIHESIAEFKRLIIENGS